MNNTEERKEWLPVENRGLRQESALCCGILRHCSHSNKSGQELERFQRTAKNYPNFVTICPNPNFPKPQGH